MSLELSSTFSRRCRTIYSLFVILVLFLCRICSTAARTYEETEAYFEKSVNFNHFRTHDLLKEPGWTVYSNKQKHERTKDLPYYVYYQISWALESQNCVGWNPTLLITCSGEGKPVLISKSSTNDSRTDCGSTESAVVCLFPIEENTSLSSTIKQTDLMTFECRGRSKADLLAAIGFREQDLACNTESPTAKQGLKLDVLWGGSNMAYSFQCKTIDSVLTTFDDKGHCMSLIRPEDCPQAGSEAPCLASLPKRYLTQIDEFFEKNPTAIYQSASIAPSAQDASWNIDSAPTPTTM